MAVGMRFAATLLVVGALAGCSKPKVTYDNVTSEKVSVQTAQSVPATASAPVLLKAADGVTVFGLHYRAEHPRAMILLFHQAGSSKDEYATIAPRLVAAGYSALAIDQRSGGGLYGQNETAANAPHKPGESEDAGYPAAEADLKAALDWGVHQKLPIVLWGSSYSAALVFDVAAQNPGKVKALLAFSPGEYMPDKHFVGHAASALAIPVFVDSAANPEEIKAAKSIADAVPGGRATQYVPVAGVHGSSTLIPAKNPRGADSNWQAALAFLKKVAP
jgi:dienelactone hydrolase